MVCYGILFFFFFLLTAALFISLQPINFHFIARRSHLQNVPPTTIIYHLSVLIILSHSWCRFLFFSTLCSALLHECQSVSSTFIGNSDLCHYTLIPIVEVCQNLYVCWQFTDTSKSIDTTNKRYIHLPCYVSVDLVFIVGFQSIFKTHVSHAWNFVDRISFWI